MKGKRVLCLLLGAVLCVGMAGCKKDKHVHDYTEYVLIQATCTQAGKIEKVCNGCGEKIYADIEAKGHTMVESICSICGFGSSVGDSSSSSSTSADSSVMPDSSTSADSSIIFDSSTSVESSAIPSEKDFSAFYTFEELYEEVKLLQYTLTKEEFLVALMNCALENVYVNKNERIKLVWQGGVNLDFGKIRTDFEVDAYAAANVYRLQVQEGVLSIMHVNGTSFEIGQIDGVKGAENPIVGITVNLQNDLLVRFKNDKIMALGKIPENPTDIAETVLMYKEYEEKYRVMGSFNKGIESVEIPFSHLGKLIGSIARRAFWDCPKLKSVTIMDGFTEISTQAFKECAALTEITIPASVRAIGENAFEGCAKLETVHFSGTRAQWEGISIASGNEALSSAKVICYG